MGEHVMPEGGWLWMLRGSLCRWMGHSVTDTDPYWTDILGPHICRYCYTAAAPVRLW